MAGLAESSLVPLETILCTKYLVSAASRSVLT